MDNLVWNGTLLMHLSACYVQPIRTHEVQAKIEETLGLITSLWMRLQLSKDYALR